MYYRWTSFLNIPYMLGYILVRFGIGIPLKRLVGTWEEEDWKNARVFLYFIFQYYLFMIPAEVDVLCCWYDKAILPTSTKTPDRYQQTNSPPPSFMLYSIWEAG
jgi:hypothetical protein